MTELVIDFPRPVDDLTDPNAFSLVAFNIRSLKSNFDSLSTLLSQLNHSLSSSLLALTETWTSAADEPYVQIPNYTSIFKHRTTGIGGGIGVYYKTDCFCITDTCTPNFTQAEVLHL